MKNHFKSLFKKTLLVVICVLLLAFGFIIGPIIYYEIVAQGQKNEVRVLYGHESEVIEYFTPSNGSSFSTVVILRSGAIPRMYVNLLVEDGFAVVPFHFRPASQSEYGLSQVEYEEFIKRVLNVIGVLRERPDISYKNIGLLGIGVGAWISPEIARKAGNIAFIINRSDQPLPWYSNDVYRDSPIAKGDSIFERDEKLKASHILIYRNYVEVMLGCGDPQSGEFKGLFSSEIKNLSLSGIDELTEAEKPMPTFYLYNPIPFLIDTQIPVLWVIGSSEKEEGTEKLLSCLSSYVERRQTNFKLKLYSSRFSYLVRYPRLITTWTEEGFEAE